MEQQLLTYSAIVFELQLLGLDVFNAHMTEAAVKVVELKHEEVWLVLTNVVVWGQVDRDIDVALYHAHKVQVLLNLLHIGRHFKEFRRHWAKLLLLHIQVEDVEERKAGPECIVKVLHALIVGLGNLHVWVE